MSTRKHAPHLRLVGDDRTPQSEIARPATDLPARLRAGQARAVRAVQRENQRAASNDDMDPTDPRWVFAARAFSQLDGAALTADRREKLMRTAKVLGIRTFDASVIIAMVQDRARRGESLRDLTTTLKMIPINQRESVGESSALWRWGAAIGCAILIAWLAARWIAGV